MATQAINSIDVAIEIVRTALMALEHALDQAHPSDAYQATYPILRDLEKEIHGLTDKTGRLAEFHQWGPR